MKEIKEAKKPHVTNNSKDDEWYTPEQYIEAARLVMGSIDLDPASNEFANEVVQAETYFDEETDGLMQEWFGNIWLNPPYSTALVKDFTEKLTNSEFEQAIVLVNNATETAWFRKMIDSASAVVFTTGRIKFRKRDGEHGTPLQGQAFIYFGDNFYAFLDEFRRFGWGCLL
jgi:phage N-6-adenine-methyltransferase